MKLFHFTAERFLEGIQKEGITKGHFPLQKNGRIGMMKNTQWLTKRPGWDQAFHDPELTELKYDRREVRLTIVIPKQRRVKNLLDKNKIQRIFERGLIPDFFADEDCENWFVFYGRIKPQWIRNVEFNPELKPDEL